MNQNDVINAFKPDFARKHGCAWFVWGDDPVHQPDRTGGWASIGGEPAFQFHRPQDLPKDVLWWTNLSKSEAWALGRWSHIKHGGFLGPEWLALMSEWGFPHDVDELKMSCSAWSEVLGRMAEWLSRWSAQLAVETNEAQSGSEQDRALHPTWSWGDGDFHEALADKLDWNVPKDEDHPALAASYCEHVEQEVTPKALVGKRKLSLALPRVAHARRLLATRFPVGNFEEVPPSEWSMESDRRWQWLEKQTLPVLLRFDDIQWAHGHERQAALWLGLRGRRFAGSNLEPVWMTGEEALEMRQFIDASPAVALRAKGWTRMNDVPHWPYEESGILHDNSIVSGLLFEGLWRAASTPVRTPTKRIKSGVSARSVWWRAADRRACFSVAQVFMSKGFDVLSYGQGTVTILFDSNVLVADWVDAIINSGVRPPQMLAHHLPIDPEISGNGIDAWLKSSQKLTAWLMLDRLLLPWLGNDTQALKSLMALSLRTLGTIAPPPALDKEHKDAWVKRWKDELLSRSRQALSIIVKK